MKKAKKIVAESYKVTPREFQRGIFLASLRQQLNKVADAHDRIVTAAKQYFNDGLSENEVRELLLIDRHSPEMITAAMERLSESDDAYQERWGFELEDHSGRILNQDDLGIEVEASTEDGVRAQAEQIVAEGSADRVVRIFRIG